MKPFGLILVYQAITFLGFIFSPFDWQLESYLPVAIFMFAVMAFECVGALAGNTVPLSHQPHDCARLVKFGALLGLALFLPSLYFYTGKSLLDFAEVIGRQEENYTEMLQIIAEPDATRKLFALLRGLLAPLTFAVLPLAVLRWKSISRTTRGLALLYVASAFVFSAYRGTDKEMGEFILAAVPAFLVLLFRMKSLAVRRRLMLKSLVLLVLVGALGVTVFAARKAGRMGSEDAFCIYDTACVPPDGLLYSALPEPLAFAASMLNGYTSQGYYGLSVALNEQFHSTLGLGHSAFVMSLYSDSTGDTSLYENSLTGQLKDNGWDDAAVWSTMYPSIANDISFWLTPAAMAVFAFLFVVFWRKATAGGSDSAAMVFVYLFILFAYSPANNQVAQSVDGYVGFWFWLIVASRRRSAPAMLSAKAAVGNPARPMVKQIPVLTVV